MGKHVAHLASIAVVLVALASSSFAQNGWVRDAAAQRVRLQYPGDRVGIGTSAPSRKLTVFGSGGTAVDLLVNGRIQTGDSKNTGGIWLNGASTLFLGQKDITDIGFYTTTGGWVTSISPAGLMTIGPGSGNERLHVLGGDVLLKKAGENAIRFQNTSLAGGSTFSFGRMVIAGDGSPELRVFYADDSTAERPVLEFDSKGIIASVKPDRFTLGSTFEAFVQGEAEPLFRLNAWPAMQLELGPGGGQLGDDLAEFKTDVAVRRADDDTLTLHTGRDVSDELVERMRIDGAGRVGIGTTDPTSTLDVQGSVAAAVMEVSADVSLGDAHSVMLVDASGGARTVSLPSAGACPGRRYTVKKVDATANAVTLQAAMGETIDGGASVVLSSQYAFVVVVSGGANAWYKVGD